MQACNRKLTGLGKRALCPAKEDKAQQAFASERRSDRSFRGGTVRRGGVPLRGGAGLVVAAPAAARSGDRDAALAIRTGIREHSQLGIARSSASRRRVRELGTLTAFIASKRARSISSRRFGAGISTNSSAKFVTEKGVVTLSSVRVPAWQGLCATPKRLRRSSRRGSRRSGQDQDTDTDATGAAEMWIGGTPNGFRRGIERARGGGLRLCGET